MICACITGAGYRFGSHTPKYKLWGYGSLVEHAQFTATLKYGNAVTEQSFAIHKAELKTCP